MTSLTEGKGRERKAPARKTHRKPKPVSKAKAGEVNVYSLKGEATKSISLPEVFHSDIRTDIIRRAVTVFRGRRRQPYGTNRWTGMRHSVRWSGKGHGVSRVPRLKGTMIGAQAPGTVGGRKAHPPKPWKIFSKKMNAKERRIARNAALAALAHEDLVKHRGHKFDDRVTLPLVVEDKIEEVESVRDAIDTLRALGVYSDVERARDGRKIRAGQGKLRGRRYRMPTSLLIVLSAREKADRGFRNLPGVYVTTPSGLNAEVLAPGGDAGRLAIFSESALEQLRGWT